jgi:hypothetical protein
MGIYYEQDIEELSIDGNDNATHANLDNNIDVPAVEELIQRH